MRGGNNTTIAPRVGATPDTSETIFGVQLSIFTFVFVLGLWGNVMVIITIFTQNRLRTASHYFIANLAVSDLGGLCLSMPIAALDHVVDWPFGAIACRFINPLKDLFLHVSMITLTAIAVDRYLNIAHPFRATLTIYETKLVIALIWLIDYLLVPLPMALVMTEHATPTGIRYCAPGWSAQHRRATRVCLSCLILLFMCITAVAYLRVAVAMKQQRQRIMERAQTSGKQDKLFRKQLEKNIRIVKAMVVIVVVFWLSVLPLTFMALLIEFEVIRMNPQQIYVIVFVVITLLFVQNCANPLILYAMSKEMKAGFAACTQCQRQGRFSFSSQFRSYPAPLSKVSNGTSRASECGDYGAAGKQTGGPTNGVPYPAPLSKANNEGNHGSIVGDNYRASRESGDQTASNCVLHGSDGKSGNDGNSGTSRASDVGGYGVSIKTAKQNASNGLSHCVSHTGGIPNNDGNCGTIRACEDGIKTNDQNTSDGVTTSVDGADGDPYLGSQSCQDGDSGSITNNSHHSGSYSDSRGGDGGTQGGIGESTDEGQRCVSCVSNNANSGGSRHCGSHSCDGGTQGGSRESTDEGQRCVSCVSNNANSGGSRHCGSHSCDGGTQGGSGESTDEGQHCSLCDNSANNADSHCGSDGNGGSQGGNDSDADGLDDGSSKSSDNGTHC